MYIVIELYGVSGQGEDIYDAKFLQGFLDLDKAKTYAHDKASLIGDKTKIEIDEEDSDILKNGGNLHHCCHLNEKPLYCVVGYTVHGEAYEYFIIEVPCA